MRRSPGRALPIITAGIALALASAGMAVGTASPSAAAWAGAPVMAIADEASGTIRVASPDGSGASHSYDVYPLMSGDPAAGASTLVANDAMGDAFWSAVEQEIGFTRDQSRFSREVGFWLGNGAASASQSTFVMGVADMARASGQPLGKGVSSGEAIEVPAGYYLLVGDDEVLPILVPVSPGGATDVTEKSACPTISKQVLASDAIAKAEGKGGDEGDGGSRWGKRTDASIGVPVAFRIKGTLPSNYDEFATYHYEFVDVPDKGEAIDAKTVRVSVQPGGEDITAAADVSVDGKDGTLRVRFDDLREAVASLEGIDHILVTYDATLTADAAIGGEMGTLNEAHITYSLSPAEADRLADTVKDNARVYTWSIRLHKTGDDGAKALAGAKLSLRDADGAYMADKGAWSKDASPEQRQRETGADGTASFDGVAAGTYKVSEEVAPSGYKAIQDFDVTVSAEMEDGKPVALTATTASKDARVTAADAKTGIIDIEVNDPREAAASSDASSQGKGTPPVQDILSNLVKTGDATRMVIGALIMAICAAAIAWNRRSRRP